jgi:hypothetical protein
VRANAAAVEQQSSGACRSVGRRRIGPGGESLRRTHLHHGAEQFVP